MELNALLALPAVLPSLPRVVALLIAELARDEPNLRRINQLVGSDPALAARVLACANGPDFDSRRQIAGLPEALALLFSGLVFLAGRMVFRRLSPHFEEAL